MTNESLFVILQEPSRGIFQFGLPPRPFAAAACFCEWPKQRNTPVNKCVSLVTTLEIKIPAIALSVACPILADIAFFLRVKKIQGNSF